MNNFRYEFSEEDAFRFANFVGAKTKAKGKELQFLYCPLCRGGKNHDKETFSINLINGKCVCQRSSCGYRGNMITLARDLDFQLNEDVSRYYNIANFNGQFKRFKDAHRQINSSDIAKVYLKTRGVSESVTERYEITTFKDTKNIIAFPFKNENGELKFIKYRNIEYVKGETQGSKEWCESNCMPILFGMNQCNLNNKRLIMTEGQIDSLSIAECGIENAVSVPTGCNGFTWVAHCWDFMNQFDEIVVFGDFENGKITLLEEIHSKFKKKVKHVRECDYMDCKDANEILLKYGREQIKKCIDNAIPVPNKKVVCFSDIDIINIYDMPKVQTGIFALDKSTYGGLPFGGVTLVTGKAGEGKSTMANEFMLSAMGQGYKVFVYSGELPSYLFKSWLNYQASCGYVREYQNDQYGETKYMVPEEISKKLDDYYRGKGFFYKDDLFLDDEEEQECLCDVVEEQILQNDVKVILLDNLMTALDLEKVTGADKYEKQSQFMKKVVRLAKKYDVAIILVAHKRKNSAGENDNDEISGASEIGNLAMLVLSYQKDKKLQPDQRLLKVTKSRLFPAGSEMIMNYDKASRRTYNLESELKNDYGINLEEDVINEVVTWDIPFEV